MYKSKHQLNSIKNNDIRKSFEFTDPGLIKFDQYVLMASFDERLKTDGSIILPHFIRRECSDSNRIAQNFDIDLGTNPSKFVAFAGSLLSLDGDDLKIVISRLIEQLEESDNVNDNFLPEFKTKMRYVLDTIDAQQRDGKYLQSLGEFQDFSSMLLLLYHLFV